MRSRPQSMSESRIPTTSTDLMPVWYMSETIARSLRLSPFDSSDSAATMLDISSGRR